MSCAPACASRRALLLQSCQLPQRLVARELSVDRIGKVRLDQPHLELGCLRQPIVDLAHAHRAENQCGRENRRCRGERIARDARLIASIVERTVDHHQQGRDAPGTGELGDLDDQRMPGLGDPLAAGKYLRYDEFAHRHGRPARARSSGFFGAARIPHTMAVNSRKMSARAAQNRKNTPAAAIHGKSAKRCMTSISQ